VFGVGFDFDHTLGLDHQLERVSLLNVLGRNASGTEEQQAEWGKLIDQALHRYRHGECTLEPAILPLFTKIVGAKCDQLALFKQFVDEVLALAPSHVTAIPGARELLDRLHAAGVATAILTNGWNPLQQKKADIIGYKGPVIVSDDLHIRKPNPQAFEALAKALNMPPEQILYVGDSPEADMVGAIGAGMQAVWFNWEMHAYPKGLPKPTAVIQALERVDEMVFISAE
jgi:putative hydrolase of the HAD superfamily